MFRALSLFLAVPVSASLAFALSVLCTSLAFPGILRQPVSRSRVLVLSSITLALPLYLLSVSMLLFSLALSSLFTVSLSRYRPFFSYSFSDPKLAARQAPGYKS